MRDMAIKMMVLLVILEDVMYNLVVSPDEKEDIIAIEINPRVSRSSSTTA